ncbi:MAG: Ppx/GppA phosphatase family protein [Nitriliruptoraceae bacterium]
MTGSRAAIDVGSNSVRLLVLDADGVRVTRRMEITRLARGVDRTGRFDPQTFEHTLDVIADFRRTALELGVDDRMRIGATSAVRDAADRDRFVHAVRDCTGIDVEVLSGDQEALLAFRGALGAVDVARPAAVVDVGGGSTEVIVGDARDAVVASVSLQVGCVRLTERCLASDPATPDELAAARTEVDTQVARMREVLSAGGADLTGARSLVAVAGTATTIAAIHLGLDHYDETRIHGTRMPRAALAALTERLVALDAAARATMGCVQPGRQDVIHAGALVLHAIVDAGGFDEVVVSEADGLDGLAASLDRPA